MTIFNVKAESEGEKKATLVDANVVEVKTVDEVNIYGAKNFSPKLDNAIADQSVSVGGTLEVDISNVFSDIDTDRNDIITITAVSADPDVVGASVVGDNLVLTRYKKGDATITVTARDLQNNSVSDTFDAREILWITAGAVGNNNFTAYQVTSVGSLISTFQSDGSPHQMHGISFASDGTLWVAIVTSLTQAKIRNFSSTGTLLSSFNTSLYDSLGGDISYDTSDDTLWIISAVNQRVYNITTSGGSISNFSVTGEIDASASRPRGIVVDQVTRTLWICDTNTDKIYNSSLTGSNISEFPTSAFDASASHPSGIGIDSVGNLWIVDENSDKAYNVKTDGTLISSFNRSDFEAGNKNMTGVSFA